MFDRVMRRRPYVAGMLALACAFVGTLTLVSPWLLGWPAAPERQAVLAKALYGGEASRSAIKLVPAKDLPPSVLSPSNQDGYVWVVATSGVPRVTLDHRFPQAVMGTTGMPDPTWTVAVIAEDSQVYVGGAWGRKGSWPPFFDGLPDRSPPGWWPIPVPTTEVAAKIAVVVVILVVLGMAAAFARAVRFVLSRRARRQGRPT